MRSAASVSDPCSRRNSGSARLAAAERARWFAAACCAVVGATLEFRETAFMAYRGIIPAHLMLGSAMLLGAVFSGGFARLLQCAGAVFLLVGAVAALTVSPAQFGDVPPVWLIIYPAIAVLVAAAYGLLVRNWLYFVSAAATVACWLGIGSLHGYRQLRPAVSGLDYILCGALSLIVAMFISLGKAGFLQRRLLRHPEQKEQSRAPRTDPPDCRFATSSTTRRCATGAKKTGRHHGRFPRTAVLRCSTSSRPSSGSPSPQVSA